MQLKRVYKKDEAGANILKSGAVIADYSKKVKAINMVNNLRDGMIALGAKVPPDTSIDFDFDINDLPEIDHIIVTRTSKAQKITQKTIDRLMVDNSVVVGDGQIMLKTVPVLNYKIVRMPGIYCCHDDHKLSDQVTARKYVADNFSGKKSPDNQNPSGYRVDNFYQCELMGEK